MNHLLMNGLALVTILLTAGCGNGSSRSLTEPSAPAPCSFTVLPMSQTIMSSGGTTSASVTTTSTCTWTATSSVTWITMTAGASGTGSGTVTYSLDPNTSTSPRTGTLSVAGQTVTVTQNASVTFSFEGVIGLSCFVCSAGSSSFGTGVAPGTRLTGTYSFDPTTPPTPSLEPTRVYYYGVTVQFTVGSESVKGNDPSQARIEIANGPPQGDSYSLVVLGGFRSDTIAGRGIVQFVWVLNDTSDLFSNTSLPLTPTFFRGQYGVASRVCIGACFAGAILEGSINALTPAPNPAGLLARDERRPNGQREILAIPTYRPKKSRTVPRHHMTPHLAVS